MFRRRFPILVFSVFVLFPGCLQRTAEAQSAHATGTQNPVTANSSYAQLPLSFEANQGQADPSVQFLARGQGYTVFLRRGEADFALDRPGPAGHPGKSEKEGNRHRAEAGEQSSRMSLTLIGANENASVSSEDRQIAQTSYLLGNDPARWRTGIPNYARVRYRSIYDGIDLIYYGNRRRLEHDFLLAPGADPARIVFLLKGANDVHIDADGNLSMKVGGGSRSSLRLLKPVAYQEWNGRRTEVGSSYRLLAAGRIGFSVSRYNHALPLIVDPVLVYSTYLGGSGTSAGGVDQGNGIVVDSKGNAYLVGSTQSTDFPVTSGVYQPANHAQANFPHRNAFVSKFNAAGTQLIFSTYLGGSDTGQGEDDSGGDQGMAIALDSDSNVYIAGYTVSVDFPTTPGAFQSVNYNESPGGAQGPTGFVSKLNSSGTQLEYSTLLGGHAPENSYLGDQVFALAVDANKNAYIAGTTSSPDFPTSAGAIQTSTASSTAAFVAKLNPTGTALVFSTFLGSPAGSLQPGIASAAAVALDGAGNCYVTGTTSAGDFPVTKGAFQVTNKVQQFNGSDFGDPFVAKLNPSGAALIYSTFLGGRGDGYNYVGDSAQAIAVDASGSAYVAGTAVSFDFPIQGGLSQPWVSGSSSGFLAKFNPTGTALDYSTRIGGSGSTISGLAVDGAGAAFVLGVANPLEFSITPDGNLLGKSSPSNPNGIFVSKVDAAGNAVEYASMFGGTGIDTPSAIAVDAAGNGYLTGSTYSTDFPATAGAFQTVDRGASNEYAQAFLSKMALSKETSDHFPTQIALSVSATAVAQGTPIAIMATTASAAAQAATGTVVFTAAPSSGEPFPATGVALDANGAASLTTSTLPPGNYTLYATYAGDDAHLSANSSIQSSGTVSFQVVGAPTAISWKYAFNGPVGYGESPSGWSVGALVTDSAGDPVSGVAVTFSAGSYMTFFPATVTTNANGIAAGILTIRKVGTFPMYAAASGIQTPATIQVVVTPAPLTVTMRNSSRIYGAANPNFLYTIQGLIGSDTVTVTPQTTASLTSEPGTYPISAVVTGPLAPNYAVNVDPATLTIGKGRLYITAKNIAIPYGQTPAQPTAYALTGFVGEDNASLVSGAPILTTAVTAATPAGFYKIGVQVGTLTALNYDFVASASGEGFVGVYKAPLTIHPDSVTIHQGDPLPAFTYTITGFVDSDTQESATSGAPAITTTAPSTSVPGRYYIVGNRGTLAAENYYFNHPSAATNGVLTILK